MGSDPSGMCKDDDLLKSNNREIAWPLYGSIVVTLIAILVFIRKKVLSLPLTTFSAIKNTLLQSNSISAGITAITQTYIIDERYEKCGAEGFIAGNVDTWRFLCFFSVIILIICTILKLNMEKLNKIPFNMLIPHTQNNCDCCDKIDKCLSSKLGFIHKTFKKWNCPKFLFSLSLTWLMFGLGISFDPYYQIQKGPDGICKCWNEQLSDIGFVYAIIVGFGILGIIWLFACNICWCCSLWLCKNINCSYVSLCFIGCHRIIAYSIILILPIPGIIMKLLSWINHPTIRFTITNFYAFLCISLFIIWLYIGFVYYRHRKYRNKLEEELELRTESTVKFYTTEKVIMLT